MMDNKSWKTSAAGIGGLLTGLATIALGYSKDDSAMMSAGLSAVVLGIGSMFARDNNKTSEQVGAKQGETK